MKMKRSEFKVLVKECVRECLREIMQEQLSPMPVREVLGSGAPAPGFINPMDDRQMQVRQEMLMQRNLMQGQLQRQAMHNGLSPMQQRLAPLDQLAGLDDGTGRRYNVKEGTGYTNPSDRLNAARAADQRPMGVRYDPRLDGMPMPAPRPQPAPSHLRLDPDLDTPVGGGPIRAPDPELLRSIYDDTLRTTFIAQQNDDGSGAVADRFAAAVAAHNPDELFSGAQNWAMLAAAK